jgi:hypothetical protein
VSIELLDASHAGGPLVCRAEIWRHPYSTEFWCRPSRIGVRFVQIGPFLPPAPDGMDGVGRGFVNFIPIVTIFRIMLNSLAGECRCAR